MPSCGACQENELYFYHPDHLGSTGMVTDNSSIISQGFLYAPFGEIISEYTPGWETDRIPKYAFNAKELDEENGMYYYSARYYAPPTFISRDPKFEKYPSISPYTYCANNPVMFVDPDGREVDVTELYRKDKSGNYVHAEQVKSFEAFMATETGRTEVGKYAKAGQTIAGHTFESDGENHKAGVDISFNGTKDIPRHYDGQTGAKIVNGRLKLDISTNTYEIGAGVETIAHEMLIHGRQFTKDFRDNGKLDYSHAYKELYDFAKQTGNLNGRYIHHWQEINSDKIMESTGIKILQEHYKNIGTPKKRSSLLQMIKSYIP
jgi:RHS repeat-associated protein